MILTVLNCVSQLIGTGKTESKANLNLNIDGQCI